MSTQTRKFSYLSCSLQDKPRWAVVVCSPTCAGVHSWYIQKEHAELVAAQTPNATCVPVKYDEKGEPVLPESARLVIERFNRDNQQEGDPFEMH